LLRPLHSMAIFPVTDGLGDSKYDRFDQLLSLKSPSWYIADQSGVRASFLGTLPLLALPVKDIASLMGLMGVLRLEDRILSRLARNRTQPTGRVTTHWSYTAALREKAPFIRA
jgi:hypothetical protein